MRTAGPSSHPSCRQPIIPLLHPKDRISEHDRSTDAGKGLRSNFASRCVSIRRSRSLRVAVPFSAANTPLRIFPHTRASWVLEALRAACHRRLPASRTRSRPSGVRGPVDMPSCNLHRPARPLPAARHGSPHRGHRNLKRPLSNHFPSCSLISNQLGGFGKGARPAQGRRRSLP